MALIVFYALAAMTVLSAIVTAFSRNIVYSAFALFGSFAGVAGIYILLGADFLFIIQVFIYIGGILVVTIFAVMLTQGVAGRLKAWECPGRCGGISSPAPARGPRPGRTGRSARPAPGPRSRAT